MGGQPFVGGRAIISPVGTIYSSNFTPDPETGIGRYSLDDFRAALYDGVRPDGSHLYPAMPYENYRKLTEQDIRALYGYFQNEVAPEKALRPPNSLGFPFNLSWGLRAWKWVALGDPGFAASSSDPVLARGQYFVEGPGHCGACHSPRNAVMAQAALTGADQAFLSGGQIAGWTAPPLRGTDSAIQGWTADDITLFLATARNAHSAINGEMQLVVRADWTTSTVHHEHRAPSSVRLLKRSRRGPEMSFRCHLAPWTVTTPPARKSLGRGVFFSLGQ